MYLSFDLHAKFQYLVAKILYDTFLDGNKINESSESIYRLVYEPDKRNKDENFAKYSLQGFGPGDYEIMLDNLIEDKRVISFSEFTERFGKEKNKHKIMKPAVDIFRDFHPNRKPILWRILLAQLCLYRALEKMRNAGALEIDIYASSDEMLEDFNEMYDILDKDVEWIQDKNKLIEDKTLEKDKLYKRLRILEDEIAKLEEKEKVKKQKEDMERQIRKLGVMDLDIACDIYGGNKILDIHSIEAVKDYLDRKCIKMRSA